MESPILTNRPRIRVSRGSQRTRPLQYINLPKTDPQDQIPQGPAIHLLARPQRILQSVKVDKGTLLGRQQSDRLNRPKGTEGSVQVGFGQGWIEVAEPEASSRAGRDGGVAFGVVGMGVVESGALEFGGEVRRRI